MVIGVPRETLRHEHRVGLNPFAVSRLVQGGHTVFVESRAGETAHFSDEDYRNAGAEIAYGPEEAYHRADLVCRVGQLTTAELELLKPRSSICAFHHLAVTPRADIERLIDLESTLIAYELIREPDGTLPVLMPLSELGGRMAAQVAAHLLQNEEGGRGVLLGNVPGVPPPTVLVLGAGTVGRAAAGQALGAGAHVIVLDEDLRKLTDLNRQFADRAATALAADERLWQFTRIADVVIGAINIPGKRVPYVITEAMVRDMKPGSVIVDLSIDQGGCVETSRPMTLDNPVFKVHGVLHYCVPNMTANFARTASRALANAAIPYLMQLGRGVEEALAADRGLANGLLMHRGRVVNRHLADLLEVDAVPVERLLSEGRSS